MAKNLKNLRMAFDEVFASPFYIALATMLMIAAFLFAVWLPNFGIIGEVWSAPNTPLTTRIKITVALIGGIYTNFDSLSAGYTIAIAMLFGINAAMATYSLKRALPRWESDKQTQSRLARQGIAAGFGGVASGALGIGCAACGSFILTATLSSLGVASALAALPLRGGEFGILSVTLLLVSLILTAKKIAAPLICKPS